MMYACVQVLTEITESPMSYHITLWPFSLKYVYQSWWLEGPEILYIFPKTAGLSISLLFFMALEIDILILVLVQQALLPAEQPLSPNIRNMSINQMRGFRH